MTEIEPPPGNETVSEQELRTLAGFLFNLIEAQITRADTKAGLVVAADSVFVTAALFQTRHSAILKIFDPAATFAERAISLVMMLMFGSLIVSILYGLLAARPSLRVKGGGETMFFFGRIARYSHREFLEEFSKLSFDEFHSGLLTEVYNTSRIANVKFARVRYSIDYLIAAVVLWSLLQLLIALST